MEPEAAPTRGPGKGTPGKGIFLGMLVLFVLYGIWIFFMNVSESGVVKRALEVAEYRYWEYAGYLLFILFILSAIYLWKSSHRGHPAGVVGGEGVRIEEYKPPEPSPGGITPVEKLAIPAKMAGGEVVPQGKAEGEGGEEVYEYPPDVGPGIYGDVYIPITGGKMLKLRVQIVEPDYLGGGGE